MLKADTGIDLVQVPYNSPMDALRDLLEGRIHLMMNASQSILSNVRTGKLRSLAASSATRVPAWMEVPTFAEQGFAGYDHTGGIAIFGPARMPPETVKRLNTEFATILRSPDVIEVFTRTVPSFEVEPSTPKALASLVNEQYEKMGIIIRRLGIRID
jgi:tripartite-type tricarboxylate transporter receptor subunit TctC